MAFKILVVDDHIDSRGDKISELPALLRSAGYEVETTADGEAAYDRVWQVQPDLIVLDIVFERQDIDGIDICRAIRENGGDMPIILITALMTETEDVLRGFEAGADDYVIRPQDLRIVLARIRANLPPEELVIDDAIRIDFGSRQVWVRWQGEWQEQHFQPLQFKLLGKLVLNAGQVLPATVLKEYVWEQDVSDSILAVYIRRLREKLEPDPSRPEYLETIAGLGYRFNGRPSRSGRGWRPNGPARGRGPDE